MAQTTWAHRGWRTAAWTIALSAGLLGAAGGAEAAFVEIEIEVPSQVEHRGLHWAIHQQGVVRGLGVVADAAPNSDHRFRQWVAEGNAILCVCLNRDEYESWYPSFGDLFQVVVFTAEPQAGDSEQVVVAPRSGWQERKAADPQGPLTVHYHRFENDYDNAGLWTWDEHLERHPAQQETFPVGSDAFGVIFQLDPADYGSPGDRIGLLPRLRCGWQFKDGPDRLWAPGLGREVYLVQGRAEVHEEEPNVAPALQGAELIAERTVLVHFTQRLAVGELNVARCRLRPSGQGEALAISAVQPEGAEDGKALAFRLELPEPLPFLEGQYEVEVPGLGTRPVVPTRIFAEGDRFADLDATMGAQYSAEATTFRVFSPGAMGGEVVLTDAARGGDVLTTAPFEAEGRGLWAVTVPGDWNGKFYSYRLQGPGLDPAQEVTDIYATCTTGPGGRGLLVELDATDPPGFDARAYVPLASPVDAIIYEMHVRDFTIAPNSGVSHKGRFLGLTEAGTHLAGDASVKTGLDHLVELGVTHVQLMPIQDFDNAETPDGAYNWGYMPVQFNSPDGWYATVPVGPERVTEFKQLVHALHQRGIGVIMDVVYNHTAASAGFDRLAPGYYFRRQADGSLYDGSGCGNELASEHPMARKFMVDSLSYWVREYGIDGFRFDLMGLHDLETMLAIRDALRRINPHVLVYGEPWTGGASGLDPVTSQERIAGTGIGAFNDHYRDAIKGDRDGGDPGFIQAGTRIDELRQGIGGALDDWAKAPAECLTYCACHDNLTTWDKITQAAPNAGEPMRTRMQRFAGLLVLTAQGVSFLHSGQELCRSKQGSANSYNLPDAVNQIDWSLKQQHREVFEYYRGLIALRKAHPLFRLRTAEEVRARLRFIDDVPAKKCVAFRLDRHGLVGEPASAVLVLLNGERKKQTFTLPPGGWQVLADADHAGTQPLAEAEGTVEVKAHSGMVLAR